MGTGTRIGITLGVVIVMAALWWIFDSAPADSRRAAFDRRVRERGQANTARGWRRPSFIAFAVSWFLILVVLIVSAIR